jgi:hypothetical protein
MALRTGDRCPVFHMLVVGHPSCLQGDTMVSKRFNVLKPLAFKKVFMEIVKITLM